MKYVSGIVALLLVFNCDGIDLGKFYAGRPGSAGSYGSGSGGGGDDSSPIYITVTTSHDPFARNPLMGQSHHSLPHPQQQYRESNYQLDAMTPQHYVGFFAMKGWMHDQILPGICMTTTLLLQSSVQSTPRILISITMSIKSMALYQRG